MLTFYVRPSAQDATGYCQSAASAIIQRFTTMETGPEAGQDVCHTLLDLVHAPPSSPLVKLAKLLQRLDNLSHVLVWARTPLHYTGSPIAQPVRPPMLPQSDLL